MQAWLLMARCIGIRSRRRFRRDLRRFPEPLASLNRAWGGAINTDILWGSNLNGETSEQQQRVYGVLDEKYGQKDMQDNCRHQQSPAVSAKNSEIKQISC